MPLPASIPPSATGGPRVSRNEAGFGVAFVSARPALNPRRLLRRRHRVWLVTRLGAFAPWCRAGRGKMPHLGLRRLSFAQKHIRVDCERGSMIQ